MKIVNIKGYQCIFDEEDFNTEYINKYGILLNKNKIPYLTLNKKMFHRIIMKVDDKNLVVDHINFNTLDNRKCNLRIATKHENARNRRSFKNNKLNVKGVSVAPGKRKSNPYRARITINGKTIHLGYFATIEDAKNARLMAIKLFFENFSNS